MVGSHVVEMEMEMGEEGGQEEQERKDKRKQLANRSYTVPFQNNRKEKTKSTTCIHIPTSYKYVTEIRIYLPEISTFLPPTS